MRPWTEADREKQRALMPSQRAKAMRAKQLKRFTACPLAEALARVKPRT